ncbi:RusA family crossover junction endodeoxyribonuclease [Streptomyces sp. NPDC056165]|uniref:RusA family crossover junction endodeoxyribonuclease n=1 Tax=Streptomyces sp. NPDC056165 TaxID=3345733 RepID=UPI0035DE3ABB
MTPSAARPGDRERAERILQFIAPDAAQSWGRVIPGVPHSKGRPRFDTDGRAYTAKEDKKAERTTAQHVRRWFRLPLTGNVAVGCVFFRPNMQQIDTDNLLKHLCDAGNRIVWIDDSQITAKYGEIQLDAGHPRTILVVAPHVSTMLRGTDNVRPCTGCGLPFQPSRKTQKFHSVECFREHRARAAVS